MKNKVIVNGVDVSECEFLQSWPCYDTGTKPEDYITCGNRGNKGCDSSHCSDNRTCTYKKAKYLELENLVLLERLGQYEEDADIQVCLFSDVARLEEEVKELKKSLSEKKCPMCGEEFLNPTGAELYELNHNLCSTLKEIKKLINKLDGLECDYGDYNCENCSSLDEEVVCTYKIHKIISDKIDEVLSNYDKHGV